MPLGRATRAMPSWQASWAPPESRRRKTCASPPATWCTTASAHGLPYGE